MGFSAEVIGAVEADSLGGLESLEDVRISEVRSFLLAVKELVQLVCENGCVFDGAVSSLPADGIELCCVSLYCTGSVG